MLDLRAEFSLPDDRVWLNAAHQGPLPDRAAEAVSTMVRWKQHPHHLQRSDPFTEVPTRLRTALADLLEAAPNEIVLANSSSYGVHLAANGLGLGEGDEVVVVEGDFPSTILPWLRLRDVGVLIRRVIPQGEVAGASEIEAAMTPKTRAVCLTWVHSFSGHMVDVDAIGEVCRRRGATFVVNGSQGIGAIPLSPSDHPIDVLTGVGFKWLCGPYGTGFCWLHPDTLDRLSGAKLYWLGALTADDLASPDIDLDAVMPPAGAARHDVFGTANFFNFAALEASVRLVGEVGVDAIREHNRALLARFIERLRPEHFRVADRGDPDRWSSIVVFEPTSASVDATFEYLAEHGVDVARRRGRIRIAPHFYNTESDIDRAVEVLHDSARSVG